MSKLLLRVIKLVIKQATPDIRGLVCRALESAAVQAKKTENPWDDLLIELLQSVIESPDK